MPDRSPADKKRDRDRRAQQNLRDKKLRHTAKLELQVAHCEKHHNDTGVQNLLAVIDGLRRQNESLMARQRALRLVFNSWDDGLEGTGPSSSSLAQDTNNDPMDNLFSSQVPSSYTYGVPDPMQRADHLSCPKAPSAPTTPSQHTSTANSTETSSPWNELPLFSDDFSSIQKVSMPWFAYPAEIAQCPDSPESPLDILYGSKTNLLANMIHSTIERRPVRDPERLAMGWMTYHLTKWIIEPSPKTYAKVPSCLRPLQEQFDTEHPIAVSCVPFRKLRSNLTHQWPLYENNRDELFGLLACCIKIRWPWGVKILERDEDNGIRIKPAFYETFMSEGGWGLTQEFINKHPNLMVGVDVNSIIFTMT